MEIEIKDCLIENPQRNGINLRKIPTVSSDELSYNQFFYQFMSQNVPVVIKGLKIKTELSAKWFGGEMKLEQLEEVLKDHDVPVANCTKQYFDSHEKIKMTFTDFVSYWNGGREAGNFYLKDFHLKQEFPELNFYKVPPYFSSDWLNEYLIDKNKDDYQFIYIGPKDSWTPFHSDVFGSYSWSANIHGRKQWFLLPPDEELKLKDSLGNLPFSISTLILNEKNVKHFDLTQECGETLFVPSGWYHQVRNIEDSVSVNHNWFNGCNIGRIIDNIINHHEAVEKEISDCKDMDDFTNHCQLMLKSSFGMNFHELVEILAHITDKRINMIKNGLQFEMFDEFTLGTNHAVSDLKIIVQALLNLNQNNAINELEKTVELLSECLNKIKEIVNDIDLN